MQITSTHLGLPAPFLIIIKIGCQVEEISTTLDVLRKLYKRTVEIARKLYTKTMIFSDRKEAGKKLAEKLSSYKGKDTVVYTLPRGGVVVAYEVAKKLGAPLGLVITRKIGRPDSPEYAIAAIAEDGHMIVNENEVASVDPEWFEAKKQEELAEAMRRRDVYDGKSIRNVKNKTAILVDDGIATGMTVQLAIQELRHHGARKIILAVPVILGSPAKTITPIVDDLLALQAPGDAYAISKYYKDFNEITDEEVIGLLNSNDNEKS